MPRIAGYPWTCLYEFLVVATHPRIYAPPTPLQEAAEQVEAWLESPTLVLLAESEGYWSSLRSALLTISDLPKTSAIYHARPKDTYPPGMQFGPKIVRI